MWSDAWRGRVALHKTHTYTCMQAGEEGRGARRQSGHGVLGNMSAYFDMVQPYMKISLCYQRVLV